MPKGADIEWEPGGIKRWKVGGKRKKRKRETSRRRRRCRGARYHSSRTESNGLDLAVVSADVDFLFVESKVDATGVSGPDGDFFPAVGGALTARGQ